MKLKLVFITVLLSQFSLNTKAQSNVGQGYERMQGQVGVTEDSISHWTLQVIEGLRSSRPSSNLNMADYQEKVRGFNTNVERAMEHFEQVVRDEVLAQLTLLARRYNDIHLDENLSDVQKSTLLRSYKNAIEAQMRSLREKYKGALLSSYRMVTDLPIQLQVNKACANLSCDMDFVFRRQNSNEVLRERLTYEGGQYISHLRARDTNISFTMDNQPLNVRRLTSGYSFNIENSLTFYRASGYRSSTMYHFVFGDLSGTDHADRGGRIAGSLFSYYISFNSNRGYEWLFENLFKISKADFYTRFVSPEILRDCRSQSCTSLSVLDLITFFNLARTGLDKDIIIVLADGSNLTLRRPAIDLGGILGLLEMPSTLYNHLPYEV